MVSVSLNQLIGLVLAIPFIILLAIAFQTFFLQTVSEASGIDEQSIASFQIIYNDINKVNVNNPNEEATYQLKKGYSIFYLNPTEATDNIKKKNPSCSRKSCLCLCSDVNCDEIIQCKDLNTKFKNSNKIIGSGKSGILNIKYTKEGISIEPKQ